MKIYATSIEDKMREDELFEQGQSPKNIEVAYVSIFGSQSELLKLGQFLIDAATSARVTDKDNWDHWHFRERIDIYPDVIVQCVHSTDEDYTDRGVKS